MGWGPAGNGHAGALKINCKGGKNVKTRGKCNAPSKQSASSCAALQPCCASQPLSSSGLTWALGAPDEAGWHTQLSAGLCCLASAMPPRWPSHVGTSQARQPQLGWHSGTPAALPCLRSQRDSQPLQLLLQHTHVVALFESAFLKLQVWRQKESLFYD